MGYDPFNFAPGGSGNQEVWANDSCDNCDYLITGLYSTWGTGNSQIATANMNQISAVAAGSTYDLAGGWIPADGGADEHHHCPNVWDGPSGGVSVRQPYQVQVAWTVNQGYAQCALSGQNGWIRNVSNELEDQFGFAIQQSQISMADTIRIGSPNDLGVSGPNTGSDTTDASGQWFDSYYVCSNACPSSPGETDALQTWTYNGIGLPHTNAIKYKCTAITIDGR